MTVRVRFAPSPTGEPHVGNIRTALFDWLFARHHGGQFLVRVEDTDQSRRVEGAVEQMTRALRWLGLDWDEGVEVGGPHSPYLQSQRLPSYEAAAARLLLRGDAYTCTCPPERLAAVRAQQQARKAPPGYDGRCRDLTEAQRAQERAQAGRAVVRFKMPRDGVSVVHDAIRGPVTFENRLLDDHVLLKSDGFPTYHLAVVVDDTAMRITHVIRGEEWLPSTPRHLLLAYALEATPPVYIHMPIILGPDGGKLSKRHGATGITEYQQQGYLPAAMVNFLALLGWSKDDHTVYMSREEIIQHFDVDRMGKTNATFDLERLRAMNAHYLRQLPTHELAARLRPYLERDLPPEVERPLDAALLDAIAPLIQERITVLSEAAALVDFFFLPTPPPYAEADLLGKGYQDRPGSARGALTAARDALAEVQPWSAQAIEECLRTLAERMDEKPGTLFTPLRVALTGKRVAPPLFESIQVLGRERSLSRLERAIRLLP